MTNSPSKIALAVGILLAVALSFSCSGGGGGDDEVSSSSVKSKPSSSSGDVAVKPCGGVSYDPKLYRCELGELIGKCRGNDYYVSYQQCVNGVIVDNNSLSSSSGSPINPSSSSLPIAGNSSSSIIESPSSSSLPVAGNSSSSIIESPSSSSLPIAGNSSSSVVSSSSSVPSSSSYVPVWGEWTEITPATCESVGEETRTNDIEETETREIPKLNWYAWSVVTPATCLGAGEEKRTCPGNASPTQTRTIAQIEYNPAAKFCDSRDGKLYKFVTIGTQNWMAENLNYNASGSKCYNNNPDNCNTYGRLYGWATAMNGSASSTANPSGVQGVCPSGWHLPSSVEWDKLLRSVDGNTETDSPYRSPTAGRNLKAKNGWNINNDNGQSGNGTDDFGFAALPGGYGYYGGSSGGNFAYVGDQGEWWSSSNCSSNWGTNCAYVWIIFNNYESFGPTVGTETKSDLHSVRCVQDSP